MRVDYSQSAANTDAFALIAEGWNELVQDGHTPDQDAISPVGPGDEVLYAIGKDGDIVGVLTFKVGERPGVARITLAYVEPSSRKRGVFKDLVAELRRLCKERGLTRIDGVIAPQNDLAQYAVKELGGYPQSVVFSVPV
jgi:GNAT superfamily N-acetyltransferase